MTNGRRCIFCGERADSREHAWPDWLLNLFPRHTHTFTAELEKMGWGGEAPRNWETRNPEILVRCVCEACNSGWMSNLENTSAPILTPLIRGEERHLTHLDQIQIAWWSAKTAMVFEAMNPVARTSTDDERNTVRTQKRAPASMQMRLAAYDGGKYSLVHVRIVVASRPDVDPTPDAYTSTFIIGRLVIQVFRPTTGDRYATFERIGIPDDLYIPILPMSVEDLGWPPKLVLDDAGFDAFARSTFRFDTPPVPFQDAE